MPLARVVVRSEYALGDPELYRADSGRESTKEILDGVAASGLVGILRQLGDVAEFAAEIFHELHEQVVTTSARGHTMFARIKKVEEILPSIEASIHGKGSFIDLAYEAGSTWHADLRNRESPLSFSDFPRFMIDSYEECQNPPRLFLLDKYDSAGNGACLKRYSDPSYFKRAWAASEPEKAQLVQTENRAPKIKRKYSRLRNGEVQLPVSTSQCNSSASSARFASPSTDVQSFSAENSTTSEMRLKPDVIMCGSQLLSGMKLNPTENVLDTNPSVVPTGMEYDNLSFSNVQNNHDHSNDSQLQREKLVFGADDNSRFDLLHSKSTCQSSSIICDEKSELVKTVGLKLSGDTFCDRTQNSEPLLNSESSKAKELARNGLLDQAKILPIIADLPTSCGWNHLDEANEVESYMDALNTLESEAETDSECQTKQIQSLSNIGNYKNESGFAEKPQDYSNSIIKDPMELHGSSNKYIFPIDTYVDSPGTLELKRSTQEASFSVSSCNDGSQLLENSFVTVSISNSLQETNDDQSPSSNDLTPATMLNSKTAAATSQFQISPPINILYTPCTKLWTNGNLLGLEPSRPQDNRLHSEDGKKGLSDISDNSVNLEQYIPNEQTSKHLNLTVKVQGSHELLSSANHSVFNSKQLSGRNYVAGECNPFDSQNDGFCAKQYSQEHIEAILSSEDEETQAASSNVLTTGVDQLHQTATYASCKEAEPCSAFNFASQLMDSVLNTQGLSPSFSRQAQRNLVQDLQIKARDTHTESSIQGKPLNANVSQSQEKPLVGKHRKGMNKNASQTFYKHNLIGKTDFGLLEKSISSSSYHSEVSSPPLEHMKISFHPMNGVEASSLKLEFPDGCINKMIDGNVLPSFWLSPGCKLPSQDGGSESDDDTFCRSYPASAEDLLSPCSDSNSELWEQDDSSIGKKNEQSDDLRRSSSSLACVSCYSGFEQMNHVDQETGLKEIYNGNDTVSFQTGYITDIPTFESFRYHVVKYDSLSISPEKSPLLPPAELPPPPPLPPLQWRLRRPSLEISEDKDSDTAVTVNHFEGPQNQNPPTPIKPENIMLMQPPLVKVGQYKYMQDNYKLDSCVKLNLSSNPKELDRREQLLHQIRDKDIQQKLKPCEDSKTQVCGSNEVDEREDLLHQIRTTRFNLRRTSASRSSFVTQPTTNSRVAAILEKASAIRQACASSDDDDWSDD